MSVDLLLIIGCVSLGIAVLLVIMGMAKLWNETKIDDK